ncbi:MAG: hypothetical protein QOF76_5211 [Solirubrobacteraceae bacterium]|jgi:uncharacterized protein YkwD|nr:hypothetical protein [Solirubrobacteraceae bacterium]
MTFKRALPACFTALLALGLPQAADAKHGMNRKESKLVREINSMRRASGLAAVRGNRRLARAADAHSEDMSRAGFFAHASSDGTDPYARVSGYVHKHGMGETLAYVPVGSDTSARAVFNMWMGSPPHLAVLTTGSFRRVGIARRHGRLGGQRVVFWTADFTTAR